MMISFRPKENIELAKQDLQVFNLVQLLFLNCFDILIIIKVFNNINISMEKQWYLHHQPHCKTVWTFHPENNVKPSQIHLSLPFFVTHKTLKLVIFLLNSHTLCLLRRDKIAWPYFRLLCVSLLFSLFVS